MEGLALFPHEATSDNPRCAPDDEILHYFLEAAMGAAVTEKNIFVFMFSHFTICQRRKAKISKLSRDV